jgi:hypothetical protein
VRLFNLFRGMHWTLLCGGDMAIAPRANLRVHVVGKDIHDDGGHIRDAYGLAADACVLMRPDGHVSAVVSSGEMLALEKHLASVGLAKPD